MTTTLDKSSLLAAIEISKNQEILKNKDLNYLESFKTTLNLSGGKKILKLIGPKMISRLNNRVNDDEYRKNLREVLNKYLKLEKPGFLLRITGGRDYFLNFIDENFEQILNDAGLYDEINLDKEGEKIRYWWDDLSDFVRELVDDKKLILGREGEKKTLLYEIDKLNKLHIKKKPRWISYEDNTAGFDILSWDENENEIFLEVKTTNNSNGLFYLTKNEWRFSISKKKKYFIYVWIQDQSEPKIITYDELNSNKFKIEDSSNAEWQTIKVTPILN
jgi:hypothetical protein